MIIVKIGHNKYSLITGDKCDNIRWKDTKIYPKMNYSFVFVNIGLFCYFCIIDFVYTIIDYNKKLERTLAIIKSNSLI